MKKLTLIFIIVLAGFTLSCKETPDKNIVINKDSGELYDALGEVSLENVDSTAFPEKWECEINKYDSGLKISIDADIIIEDMEKCPVATIKPHYISKEQAKKIVKAIFGAKDVYHIGYELSKEELMNFIVEVKAEQQEAYNKGDNEEADSLQKVIDNLTEDLKTAPEKIEPIPYNGEFEIYDNGDTEILALRENPVEREGPTLEIHNVRYSQYGNGYNSDVSYMDAKRETYICTYDIGAGYKDNPVFTTDDAVKAVEKASRFLKSIDVDDVEIETIAAIRNKQDVWDVTGYRIFLSGNTITWLFPRLSD